jgi:ABC-type sugar transport system ATPase subunit
MSIDTQIVVRTVSLGKSFGPVHALRDVTPDLGKSTFISLVSGAAGPTAGRVEVFGELAEITSPREGAKLGIQVVHHEPKLTNEASICRKHFPDRPRRHVPRLRRRHLTSEPVRTPRSGRAAGLLARSTS